MAIPYKLYSRRSSLRSSNNSLVERVESSVAAEHSIIVSIDYTDYWCDCLQFVSTIPHSCGTILAPSTMEDSELQIAATSQDTGCLIVSHTGEATPLSDHIPYRNTYKPHLRLQKYPIITQLFLHQSPLWKKLLEDYYLCLTTNKETANLQLNLF